MIAAVGMVGLSTQGIASAQGLGVYGFQPYGFYQPYGVRYRSSVAKPPYFALNPPVYYGTRHFRPYGISPFAAPPQVSAPAGYEGRAGAPGRRSNRYEGPVSNPFICNSCDAGTSKRFQSIGAGAAPSAATVAFKKAVRPGKVQTNPFVKESAYFARR